MPKEIPTYLSAAAAPSVLAAPRKFCSVCGRAWQMFHVARHVIDTHFEPSSPAMNGILRRGSPYI